MMGKMTSILLFVAAVFVLVAGDCIKDIQEFEKNAGNTTVVGGYVRVKDPENDAGVRKIVADSIKYYNEYSTDPLLYRDNDHYVAYEQLANGLNYCSSFQIISEACKNGMVGGICESWTKKNCTVTAHKAFEATYATINKDSLNCQPPVAA